jgi:hypothetical protein
MFKREFYESKDIEKYRAYAADPPNPLKKGALGFPLFKGG